MTWAAIKLLLAGLWAQRLTRAVVIAGGLCLGLWLYTAGVVVLARKCVAPRIERQAIERVEKAQARETVRRVEVLKRVQVRSAEDIKKIDALATERAALLEEINRASMARDNAVCLDPDGVRRLAGIR